MYTDTLIIPAEEDSVEVSFDFHLRDNPEEDMIVKQLSFILWREEGKQLFLDPGR